MELLTQFPQEMTVAQAREGTTAKGKCERFLTLPSNTFATDLWMVAVRVRREVALMIVRYERKHRQRTCASVRSSLSVQA